MMWPIVITNENGQTVRRLVTEAEITALRQTHDVTYSNGAWTAVARQDHREAAE